MIRSFRNIIAKAERRMDPLLAGTVRDEILSEVTEGDPLEDWGQGNE